MTEQENILRWWDSVPASGTSKYKKKIISINLLEDIAGAGRNTYQRFFNLQRPLPDHHLPGLIKHIKPVGYKPLEEK